MKDHCDFQMQVYFLWEWAEIDGSKIKITVLWCEKGERILLSKQEACEFPL